MVELGVSKRFREYVERLNKQSLEKWGREVYPEKIPLDLLVGSVCKVIKAGVDYVTMVCGEYEVTLNADMALGEPEIYAEVVKRVGKNEVYSS